MSSLLHFRRDCFVYTSDIVVHHLFYEPSLSAAYPNLNSFKLKSMSVGAVEYGKPFLIGHVPENNKNQHMYNQLSLASNMKVPGIYKGIDILARGISVSNYGFLQNDLSSTFYVLLQYFEA